jgi:hypothetical protein
MLIPQLLYFKSQIFLISVVYRYSGAVRILTVIIIVRCKNSIRLNAFIRVYTVYIYIEVYALFYIPLTKTKRKFNTFSYFYFIRQSAAFIVNRSNNHFFFFF